MNHTTASKGPTQSAPLRIVSLLPSATEIVAALGAEAQLVGVSHACDFPVNVKTLPCLTESIVDPALPAQEIDRITAAALRRGESLYRLDETLLRELKPDVVITQALCDVCAISYQSVARAVGTLPGNPALVSLEPGSIEEILSDILRVGAALGREVEATRLVDESRRRLSTLREQVKGAERPRVLGLEWLDPPFYGGHWVPEQILAAGGEPVIGAPGAKSERMTWETIHELDPDVIIVMPCGYDAGQSLRLLEEVADRPDWTTLRAVRAGKVIAVDANAYFSRPGPRVIPGAEVLGHLLHPSLVPEPVGAEPSLVVA